MRQLITAIALLAASPASAHIGHWGELAGHDHLLAGVAIGTALGIGLLQGLRGKGEPQDEADDAPEEELEEAAA